MPKIKFQSFISDIRGNLGGVIFDNTGRPSRHKHCYKGTGLPYVRKKPTSYHRFFTEAQQNIKQAVGIANQRWRDVLTTGEKNQWNSYAGTRKTGFNEHLKNCTRLHSAGITTYPKIPPTSAPTPPEITGAYIDDETETIIICFKEPTSYASGARLRAWAQTKGKLVQPQIAGTVRPTKLWIKLKPLRSYGGSVYPPLTPRDILIRMDTVNPDGAVSTSSATVIPERKRRMKNFIINGVFNVWQRAVGPVVVSDGYTADRWKVYEDTDGTLEVRRSTTVPDIGLAGVLSSYSHRVDCTVADVALLSNQQAFIEQILEGYNYARLYGDDITLTFCVRSNKTGKYYICLQNSAQDRSYVTGYTINSADTWEKKTVTIPYDEAGTWLYTNGAGLRVKWCLGSAAAHQGAANEWHAGYVLCGTDQVNLMDSILNDFYLSSVQLEPGSLSTPFNKRSIDEEVEMCQRYYEKSYDLDTLPGAITGVGQSLIYATAAMGAGGGMTTKFRTRKRAIPTIHTYSQTTGAIDMVRNWGIPGDEASNISDTGQTGFLCYGVAATASLNISWQWIADAELV